MQGNGKGQGTAAWLEQYREAGAAMERLEEDMRRWEARGRRVAAGTRAVRGAEGEGANPQGGSKSGRESCMERLAALRIKMLAEMDALEDVRKACQTSIAALASPTQRQVMRLRYLEGLTLEKAAEELHYSVRQVGRLHTAALRELHAGREGEQEYTDISISDFFIQGISAKKKTESADQCDGKAACLI